MQSQLTTAVAAVTRHPKTLHAKDASYQQVQQVLHSHLYQQTGHYATVKEVTAGIGILMVIVVVAVLAAAFKALFR